MLFRSLQHNPSKEYSGLISIRIGWFDLLSVQGTLKNLLQHQFESINSSALSLLYGPTLIYMTPRKTIALTIQTFIDKVTSLLFNMLPKFVIAFLPSFYLGQKGRVGQGEGTM